MADRPIFADPKMDLPFKKVFGTRERKGLLARDTQLLQAVVRILVGVVFGLLCRAAKAQGIADPRPGSIVAVQRFGDGLVQIDPEQYLAWLPP